MPTDLPLRARRTRDLFVSLVVVLAIAMIAVELTAPGRLADGAAILPAP